MQNKNIGTHKLGSRGYSGKDPVWEKEDKKWRELNMSNPFNQFKDPQEKRFIRARYGPDKETGVLVTDAKAHKIEDALVMNLPA